MSEHEVQRCEHPDCGAEDDHPKFHLLGGSPTGLAWTTYHHDCAALLGHEKAAIVVQHTEGAKGEALRQLLTDPDHPVHAALAEHSAREAERSHQQNLRALSSEE